MPRYFTVEEARASLPDVRTLMERAQELKARVDQLGAGMARSVAPSEGNGHHSGNGDEPRRLELELALQRLQDAVRQIEAIGCQVKDLDLGLVDWPHLREDHEVYLCWHVGELDILYWHEIDAGFRGRQPL